MSAPRVRTNLRELRERKRVKLLRGEMRPYSIRDAERDTGIGRGSLSQLERGRLMPTEDQHKVLLRVYGRARWWIELGDE